MTEFKKAIELDERNQELARKVMIGMAEANLLLENYEQVLELCNKYLEDSEVENLMSMLTKTEENLKPLLLKARALIKLERYEEAIMVLMKAKDIETSEEVEELLTKAKKKLTIQQGNEETHYEVLGVPRNVTTDELKAVWKRLAKENHPDKFANATEDEKTKQEEKMKKINVANDILSDTSKRKIYDQELFIRELSAKEAQTPEKNKESTEESGHNEDSNDYLNKQFEEDLKEAWNDFWSQKLRKMKKARPPTNGEKDEFLSDYLKNNAEYIKDKYGIEIPAGGFNCYNKRQERRRKKRK